MFFCKSAFLEPAKKNERTRIETAISMPKIKSTEKSISVWERLVLSSFSISGQ